MANSMVVNYKLKYGNIFSNNHPKGVTSYFTSQSMYKNWQFLHYKTLIEVLETRNQRKFWWSLQQEFIKEFYGSKYCSAIFEDIDCFEAAEFYACSWHSNIPINKWIQPKEARKLYKQHKEYLEHLQEEIKNLKDIYMDKDYPDLEKRLFAFLDLQTLEENYPGIGLARNLLENADKFAPEEYKKNLDSMSFYCHYFQDIENITRFLQYKGGRSDAFGKFSIPRSSKFKPNNLLEDNESETENLVKYSKLHLEIASSTRPGFVPTQSDSRRALVSNTDAPSKSKPKSAVVPSAQDDNQHNESTGNVVSARQTGCSGLKQVNRAGKEVVVNTAQDSDDDNQKAVNHALKTKKNPDKDKAGHHHVRLYFYTPGEGPKQDHDSTYWNVADNHHRCICHVIALILGAGLRALKISKKMVRPEKADMSFPVLETIIKVSEPTEEEIIVEGMESMSLKPSHYIDPDNAEADTLEPGWENHTEDDNEQCEDQSGFGFTLKKVCQRLAWHSK
ncbi:hypothetical protein PtB15_14B182 [Puccinia triticina]|nr:hypothetical protein PtB15_14B182 [Puccinia triticina]